MQFDKAIADHTEAIRLRPGYADAFCDRAFAYSQIGKDDKALSDYDNAVRLDPKDAIALCGAGRHLRCHGALPRGDRGLYGGYCTRWAVRRCIPRRRNGPMQSWRSLKVN